MKLKLFSYNYENTVIHRLSGLTKLICFLLLTFAVMFSYDIRVILGMLIFSVLIMRAAKITFSQIKTMVIYVLIFIVINAIITYSSRRSRGSPFMARAMSSSNSRALTPSLLSSCSTRPPSSLNIFPSFPWGSFFC